MPPRSVLKDHCVQHLPDGSVTVESILIQAAAHSEDPGTKVLLVSWTYQVSGGSQGALFLAGQDRWGLPSYGGRGRCDDLPPFVSGCRMKSWEVTSHRCLRRASPRPPAEVSWSPKGPRLSSRAMSVPQLFPLSPDVEPPAAHSPCL